MWEEGIWGGGMRGMEGGRGGAMCRTEWEEMRESGCIGREIYGGGDGMGAWSMWGGRTGGCSWVGGEWRQARWSTG